MSTTRYRARAPKQRMEESRNLWGDLVQTDNAEQMERLRKNLRLIMCMELTPRQAQIMEMHFDKRMRVTEIAQALDLSVSSVSRTLRRGKERLREYLQYSF